MNTYFHSEVEKSPPTAEEKEKKDPPSLTFPAKKTAVFYQPFNTYRPPATPKPAERENRKKTSTRFFTIGSITVLLLIISVLFYMGSKHNYKIRKSESLPLSERSSKSPNTDNEPADSRNKISQKQKAQSNT